VVGDVLGDTVWRTVRRTVLWATARCIGLYGLATGFGASTVMLGSEELEAVAVCDIAVPVRPHSSSAIDEIATAGLEMKRDENLIAMFSQCVDSQFHLHPGTPRRSGRYDLSPLHSILIAV